MADKMFYEKLQLRKENGEKLFFESITYEELKELWWVETVMDTDIADLYTVTEETVRKKRYKLGIKRTEMFAMDRLREYITTK